MALGFDAISSDAISGEIVVPGQILPVPTKLIVADGNAGILALGAAIGAGLIFGIAFQPSSPVTASEAQFGTHALHNAEYAVTRTIFPSVRTPPTLTGKLGAFVNAPPQTYVDPFTGQVWQSTRIGATPQPIVLTLGSGQNDPTQPTATVFNSAIAPLVTTQPVTVFFSIPPQNESRDTAIIFASVKAGAAPQPIPMVQGAPQQVDLTLQAQLDAPQASPQRPIITQVAGSPQTIDVTIQATLFKPLSTGQAKVPALIAVPPQSDPTQLAASRFGVSTTPPIVPNPIAAFFATLPQFESRDTTVIWPSLRAGKTPPPIPLLIGAPQSVDLTQQAILFRPTAASQGSVPSLLAIPPQSDTTQISPILWPSLRAVAIIQNPIAKFFVTLPQFESRDTAIIWSSLRAGQKPPVLTSIWAAPQSIDLTLQGSVFKPSIIPPVISVAFKTIIVNAQQLDLTQQGWILGTAPGKQAKVPTLVNAAPQLMDLTQQNWIKAAAPVLQSKVPTMVKGVPQLFDFTLQANLTTYFSFSSTKIRPAHVTMFISQKTTKMIFSQKSSTMVVSQKQTSFKIS